LLGASAGAAESGVGNRITNFASGQTVRYPVVLIRGQLADQGARSVSVTRGEANWKGLAGAGQFKVLVELTVGANKLAVTAGGAKMNLTLNYKPQTNSHVVRVHYFVDNKGDTRFQTPIEDDPQNWRGKLDTAMKLMQTFTADRMARLGLGHKTFNIELDKRGRVKVHILKGRKSGDEYRKLTGHQLYSEAGRELRRQSPNKLAKNLVIPAFTRFDPKTGKVGAHTALGGGSLALFGGGNLFSWPDSIPQTQAAFMNATMVDPSKVFSDSVGRHTFWAIASTTMGAALHEMGHTFGLPHSRDVHDIMTRGHDRFNRFFTLTEPPHARRKTAVGFKDNEVAYWAPISGGALAANRFFAMDDRKWKDSGRIVVGVNKAEGKIAFESGHGLLYVGVWATTPDGQIQSLAPAYISRNGKRPGVVAIDLAGLKKQLGDMKFKFKVIDGEGLHRTFSLSDILGEKPETPGGNRRK